MASVAKQTFCTPEMTSSFFFLRVFFKPRLQRAPVLQADFNVWRKRAGRDTLCIKVLFGGRRRVSHSRRGRRRTRRWRLSVPSHVSRLDNPVIWAAAVAAMGVGSTPEHRSCLCGEIKGPVSIHKRSCILHEEDIVKEASQIKKKLVEGEFWKIC